MIIFGSTLMLFPLAALLTGSPEDKADLPSTLLTWVMFITAYVAIKYVTSMWTILRMTNAKSITEDDDPELYHIVQDMSMVAGLPMPKIYIIDTAEPNAFATGTSYKRSAIAVTTGIRKLMTREELEGVISHEMSHIKNYDIRVSTIAAAFVGFVELLGNCFTRWKIELNDCASCSVRDIQSHESQMILMAFFCGGRRPRLKLNELCSTMCLTMCLTMWHVIFVTLLSLKCYLYGIEKAFLLCYD